MEQPANPYSSPSANLFGSSSQTSGQVITAEVISQLQRTKPWARLLGVIAWLVVALILVGSVGFLVVILAGFASPNTGGTDNAFLIGMACGYLFISVIYIYPAMKIWGYGSAIKRLMASRSETDLVKALDQQRSLWKFVGIITLILVCLYAIGIGLALTVGVAGAMKGLPTPGQ
ncbi:MAG: hypothetical protein V4662_26595 [Verrucomicrobiota bacterium]